MSRRCRFLDPFNFFFSSALLVNEIKKGRRKSLFLFFFCIYAESARHLGSFLCQFISTTLLDTARARFQTTQIPFMYTLMFAINSNDIFINFTDKLDIRTIFTNKTMRAFFNLKFFVHIRIFLIKVNIYIINHSAELSEAEIQIQKTYKIIVIVCFLVKM